MDFNQPVITLRPVVEVPTWSGRVIPWPVEPLAPRSWMTVHADCTDTQIGLFVAALASPIDVAPSGGRAEFVDALLAEEVLVIGGGLRARDTSTGTEVVPGCCSGLDDWREWTGVLVGRSPWWGHDPSPEVEVVGDDVRCRQEGGPSRARWDVSFPRRELPSLLMGVQQDLVGFLGALGAWARRSGLGRRADTLVEAVDRELATTTPLDLDIAAAEPGLVHEP